MPVLDPVKNTPRRSSILSLDPKTPSFARSAEGAVGLLGRRAHLGQPHHRSTTRCMDEKGRVWMTARIRPGRSGLLQEGLRSRIGARSCRIRRRAGSSRCTIRRPASVSSIEPLLQHPASLFRPTPTARCGPARAAPSERGRLARHQEVRGDRRRRKVAGLDAADRRHGRRRQAHRHVEAEPAASTRPRTSG